MIEYECIKSFGVPYYDTETDEYDESQTYSVKAGSIWEREEDDLSGSYTGADIHLDGDNGWLEVSKEILNECFREVMKNGKRRKRLGVILSESK